MEQAIGDINLEMLKELSEAHGISGNEKGLYVGGFG